MSGSVAVAAPGEERGVHARRLGELPRKWQQLLKAVAQPGAPEAVTQAVAPEAPTWAEASATGTRAVARGAATRVEPARWSKILDVRER